MTLGLMAGVAAGVFIAVRVVRWAVVRAELVGVDEMYEEMCYRARSGE